MRVAIHQKQDSSFCLEPQHFHHLVDDSAQQIIVVRSFSSHTAPFSSNPPLSPPLLCSCSLARKYKVRDKQHQLHPFFPKLLCLSLTLLISVSVTRIFVLCVLILTSKLTVSARMQQRSHALSPSTHSGSLQLRKIFPCVVQPLAYRYIPNATLLRQRYS